MQIQDAHLVKGDPIEVTGKNSSVILRKVQTPKGERLAISSPNLGNVIFLDALNLESVTWQGAETFAALAEEADPKLSEQEVRNSIYSANMPSTENEASLKIANEYTLVSVSVNRSESGDSVLFTSENLGYTIRLGAPALEALTTSTPDVFDRFLSTPFGPE